MTTDPRLARTVALALVAAATLAACATRQPDKTATGDAAAAASATPPARAADVAAAAPSPPARSTDADAARARATLPGEASVYFEFDSSALDDRARSIVQQHARYVGSERRPIRLEGNADERGSREYNIALGQRRAEAVRRALTLQGTNPSSVEAISYGEERPRCTDDTEPCWSQNRRVDFVYSR
jgi:peptidoglycan-associated lipoprotein